ncbi:MAG: hypothetical protein HQK79_01535 [Desulfobacterales bacterium]|nr:hypothetical protein [Desulfobacterales bacterium]MBF0396390.1 hypothetical protein [Desulfobacterales bacterium]
MEHINSIYVLVYNLVRGPLVWISSIIFIVGTIYQIWQMLLLTKINTRPIIKVFDKQYNETHEKNKEESCFSSLKRTICGIHPIMIVVTTLFHILLIIIPLTLLAHNILLENAVGFSLFSFSEKISDILTVLFLVSSFFFFIRRIFLKRVRIISTFYDYFIWFLATAPFLTGFLAYHHIFNYRIIITLHIFLGELMLVAIPFTKFSHMIFFFVFRFIVVNEYSFRKHQVIRTW